MLSEKDSNRSGVELLGFIPYIGFDLKNDGNSNPIVRWKSLMSDNKNIFKDTEKAKELYEKNQKIIEYNYKRLTNTDWKKERVDQYNKLPEFIKENLNNF
jgi:hypothetical protein